MQYNVLQTGMVKKQPSNKTDLVSFRLAPALKKAALAAATADHRTLSGWLEKIVRENLPKVEK